jgi:hypothetical protein
MSSFKRKCKRAVERGMPKPPVPDAAPPTKTITPVPDEAPFGFKIVEHGASWSFEPEMEEIGQIETVVTMSASRRGAHLVAKLLNMSNSTKRGEEWTADDVRAILKTVER